MGGVVYAAPDGLMLLSPGGSRIVTENLLILVNGKLFSNQNQYMLTNKIISI